MLSYFWKYLGCPATDPIPVKTEVGIVLQDQNAIDSFLHDANDEIEKDITDDSLDIKKCWMQSYQEYLDSKNHE